MEQSIDITHLRTLKERLTLESDFILRTLYKESKPINKLKIATMTNELFSQQAEQYGKKKDTDLIDTRYLLDVSMSRLDAAGLVNIDVVGRVRMYEISDLGIELLKHIVKTNQGK